MLYVWWHLLWQAVGVFLAATEGYISEFAAERASGIDLN